jgi:DnaJ-class molecular chaperone
MNEEKSICPKCNGEGFLVIEKGLEIKAAIECNYCKGEGEV